MSERIKELVEKSYIYDKQNDSSFFNKEKFAELIIEDCICVVDGAVHHRLPASSYADIIREHFAVE